MTGEPIPAPSSPRDGEDVAITNGQPKVYAVFSCLLGCALF